MSNYSVAEARQNIAQVLDHAERGDAVVIERRGVRFRLIVERPPRTAKPKRYFTALDPAIETGQWSWVSRDGQLEFEARVAERPAKYGKKPLKKRKKK